MLNVNGKEIEDIYFNGTQLDHVYVNGVMVYESTVYIAKPTLSGAYTFDTAEHEPKISGYNADAMEVSGIIKASAAGTYTVTFRLKKGYAWDDETRDDISLTWSIARRSIAVPTLSATWFAWAEGAQHSVIVSNIAVTYVDQSGDLYQSDNSNNIGATHTVTWTLKYPDDTVWSVGGNDNKTAVWGVYWQSGASHYANDIFNDGWGFDNLIMHSAAITGGMLKDNCIYIASNKEGTTLFSTKQRFGLGRVVHMIVKGQNYGSGYGILSLRACNPDNFNYSLCQAVTGFDKTANSGDWKEIAGTNTQTDINTGRTGFGLGGSGTSGGWCKRIWIS